MTHLCLGTEKMLLVKDLWKKKIPNWKLYRNFLLHALNIYDLFLFQNDSNICMRIVRPYIWKIHFSLKRFSSPYPWRWRWKRREQVPISIQNKRAAASMSLKVPLQKCKFSSPSLMTPHSQLNRNPPPHFLKGQWQNCSTTFSSCKTFNQGEKRPKKGLAWNEEIWRAQKRSSLLLCSFSVLL